MLKEQLESLIRRIIEYARNVEKEQSGHGVKLIEDLLSKGHIEYSTYVKIKYAVLHPGLEYEIKID
jgi:DNA-directed RNA polymerase subunit F